VNVPNAPSIDASRLAQFRQNRDQALALLYGVPLPGESQVTLLGTGRK